MTKTLRHGAIRNTKNKIINFSVALTLAVTSMSGALPLFTQPALAAAPDLTVCAVGCDSTTIQGAVNLANDSDIISVADGTYLETLTLNKSLTILGTSKANTIIKAPASLPTTNGIVTVSGSGVSVSMSRLTVSGTGPSACGSIYAGVYVTSDATASLKNMNVQSIRDSVFSGCQNGRAIYVGGAGGVGHATIDNVVVTDYQKGGIYVSNTGSTANITDSRVIGAGSTGVIAQNGIAIISGATATISNTIIRKNSYNVAGTIATGVLLYNAASTTSVDGTNSINNNQVGLYSTNVAASQLANIDLAGITGNLRNAAADTTAQTPTSTFVDSQLTGTIDANGNDMVVANGSTHVFGYDAFNTVQAGINAAASTYDVTVAAGDYHENLSINKQVSVLGASAATTRIIATNGNSTPVTFSSNNATLDGFTITHEYTPTELSNWSFNNNGVTFNQGTTGNTLSNSVVSLNRNGIYLNNSQGNIITGNTITNNRTGINMTNTLNGTQITGNTISGNWTIGLVMYSATPTLATDLSTIAVSGNTFDQNWYSEILIKDAPLFTGLLNVTNNTFTDAPVTHSTSANSSLNEPSFASQKPVSLGGSATKPAQELPTLRIYNAADAAFDYTSPTLDLSAEVVVLTNGTNTVSLPQDAVITASDPAIWNGVINAPTIVNTVLPLPSGTTQGIAIEVGSTNVSLTFDKAARLLIGGEAGKLVGYMQNGTFVQIKTVCSADTQTAGDNLPAAGDCYMNVGNDLVVWTKHFTTFATFSLNTVAATSSTVTSSSRTVSSTTARAVSTTASSAATSAVETAASVLGISSGIAGGSTNKAAVDKPANKATDSSRFLGLGWYWLLVLAVIAGIGAYRALGRRVDR